MSTPQDPSGKKGTSPWAVVGIGCGTLLLLGLLGGGLLVAKGCAKFKEFAEDPSKAAVWALELNPEIEVIEKNDQKREITYRTKSTGETTTISYDELEKGKLTIKDDKGGEYGFDASKAETEGVKIKTKDGQTITAGVAAASAPPAGVPLYPGLTLQDGGFRAEDKDSVSGMAVGTVTAELVKVKEYYETTLKAAGYEMKSLATAESESVSLTGNKADGLDTISVVVSPDSDTPGKVQVTTQYRLPKTSP